jgi:hypothetical protein
LIFEPQKPQRRRLLAVGLNGFPSVVRGGLTILLAQRQAARVLAG